MDLTSFLASPCCNLTCLAAMSAESLCVCVCACVCDIFHHGVVIEVYPERDIPLIVPVCCSKYHWIERERGSNTGGNGWQAQGEANGQL